MTNRKPILCLDFDGVCHSYASGWKGAAVIPDPPVDGLWQFLNDAVKVFEVAIFSSRSGQEGGIEAMKEWFSEHGSACPGIVAELRFPIGKPPAFVGIDDRVITFRGSWPAVEELRAFKTWTQDPRGATNTFPRGKVNASDEGELKLAVYDKEGTVFLDFGKTVAWLGLDAESAKRLAALLIQHAQHCAD